MYRKSEKGWLKHWDFILLDLMCLQMAFLIAFMVRHGVTNPYAHRVYRLEVIALVLIQIVVVFITENFKNVLKRGHYKEFVAALKQAVLVTMSSTFYLFLIQSGAEYSRMTLLLTGVFYLLLSCPVRLLWKKHLLKGAPMLRNPHSLLVVTDMERVAETLTNVMNHGYAGFRVSGLAITDRNMTGQMIEGVPVVADRDTLADYVCKEWVDQVLLNVTSAELSGQVVRDCSVMGVTVHQCLNDMESVEGRQQRVERLGNYTVLTTSVNIVSSKQLFYKRILDIIGGFIGCLLTGVLYLFVAPAIYLRSPGPIFFSQIRVGRNGKQFKLYKFRSMYMDAEERKKELMAKNQVEDGMMFKMKDDPRIIKGVGHFIRKFSIDEFPQFYNVLKGEMSLVGTRPPTVDEWEKYSLHHRVRLAIKPGITGLWQVSGRSAITDFEEVVKLDVQYISEWSIGKDIKILFKTVGAVFGSSGAM